MKVVTPRPAHSPLPPLKLALLAIGFLALLDPRTNAQAEKIKPFTEGPWGTRFLITEPEPEPEPAPKPGKAKDSRPFFSRFLPGPKAGSESPYVAPPSPAPAPPQAPKSKPRFRAPWAKGDTAPLSDVPVIPAPAPAPAPKSNPISRLFKRGPGNDTAAADDVRFEPRDIPVQDEPSAAADSSSTSRSFLGLFKRQPKSDPVPEVTLEADPEPAAESPGLFARFKREPKSDPVPEVTLEADPEPAAESPGLFARFKREPKSDPVPEVTLEADPEPAAESPGLFARFKREPKSDPVPEVTLEADPEPAAESPGLFARFKREPKSDPVPEVTLEADPEPAAESPGLLARFKPQPKSDPAPEVTLEAEPAPAPDRAPRSGGLLARFRSGGSGAAAATATAAAAAASDEPEPEPLPEPKTKPQPKPVKQTVSFVDEIEPIFDSKCIRCHNRDTLHGRISLESRALAFKDTPAGPVIIPGDPESSILMQNISSSRTATKSMPPVGHNVSRKEKSLIYTWIKEGANWP